jgi:SAM-dependent methyltransferase
MVVGWMCCRQRGEGGRVEAMGEGLLQSLRVAYDRAVCERDGKVKAPWKLEERGRFLSMLRAEGKRTLLEIGAGTGQDGLFFQENGLQVTCTDLSPENVRRCQEKGLRAHVAEFRDLGVPAASFDAAYAVNCLLHVPRAELQATLESVREALRPGGLFCWGQYGGRDSEGVYEGDHYRPKRFFSFLTDEGIQVVARACFEVVQWRRVQLEGEEGGLHFQSLVVRRRENAREMHGRDTAGTRGRSGTGHARRRLRIHVRQGEDTED